MRELTPDEAYNKAKECEYAQAAVQPEDNPINWADAEAFYLEGYNQAVQEINAYLAAGAKHVHTGSIMISGEMVRLKDEFKGEIK